MPTVRMASPRGHFVTPGTWGRAGPGCVGLGWAGGYSHQSIRTISGAAPIRTGTSEVPTPRET
jgi:hypothetical protein